MSSAKINGSTNTDNRLNPGAIIIYKTNAGRYGKLMVKEYGYNIYINYVTYNSSGTVYRQGNNLRIRGTWSCDLDLGVESSTGADFWWEQATSTVRYLTPQNSALFLIYMRRYEDVNDQFASYVSNEETRFVDYTRAFIDQFSDKWSMTEWLWGQCRFLGSDHLTFADKNDLVYMAGHGAPSSFWLQSGEECTLGDKKWGSWSESGRTGDLEYIVFHSCQVLSLTGDWRSRWKQASNTDAKPFSGLHVAMGYRTDHYNGDINAGPSAADDFAANLEAGYSVRYAWYKAAIDNRSHTSENKPSIFFVRPHKYETIDQHNSVDYRFEDPSYKIDAYYMNDSESSEENND
jgi:hypothetical protein